MRLDLRVVAGHGQQGLGHAVADVVPDHVTDQQQRDQHADARQDQVLPVVGGVELLVEQTPHRVDGPVQNDGGAPGEHADHQTQQEKFAVFRNMSQEGAH